MTMKPYIFLSSDYLVYTQDGNGNTVDITTISTDVAYEQVIYFADMYGNIVNRTIDTLILQDTNIKNMTVKTLEDISVLTLSNNTSNTVVLKAPSSVTTTALKITIPNDGVNPTTVVGKIGLYGFICNLFALTDSNYTIEANEGSYRVLSGKYIHWADYKKWVAKISIDNLEKEQFDLLTAQADLGEITVIPYEDIEIDEIYNCAVSREYKYELDRKTKLFKLEMELNEL